MNNTNARFDFIKKALENLQARSSDKPITYHDTTKNGLKLVLHPSAIKTFFCIAKSMTT